MKNGISKVFDEECKDLQIDKDLVRRLNTYQNAFVHKNSEHQDFFGGSTTGVQVVRFLPADRNRWFDEILEINDTLLEEKLHALPTVNTDWLISSDAMNLSCAWLAHAVFKSNKLNDKQKHDALIDIFLVLQYKYLTSILYRFFKYPADRETAEATYSLLSYKYALKVHGSWSAVLRARAEEIISKESIHYDTIVKMDDDKDVIYLLNDTQGRIKDMMKNIYDLFIRVSQQGIKIATVTAVTTDHDGEEILKDKTKSMTVYGRYIRSVIIDKNSFVRTELTNVIEKIMQTMPPKLFNMTLEWMSINYSQVNTKIIDEVLEETLLHSFDYLGTNRELIRNNTDLSNLLAKLRGVYMSSRSTDQALIALREKTEKMVRMAVETKNESVISSVRTGVLLYIVLRSFTMKHYSV